MKHRKVGGFPLPPLFFLLPLLLALQANPALATTCSGYSFYRSVTIDHTKIPNTDQASFPVLISGVYDGTGGTADLRVASSGGKVQSSSGTDIVFASDASCTVIPYEQEKYISTTGEIAYWVQVASVSHTTDTVIYMFYGKSGASSQSNASGVWDANYKVVYHFPNGSSLSATDSTGNANGVNHSATATAGQIDGAAAFSGSSQYIESTNNITLSSTTHVTFEAWVNDGAIDSSFRQILRLHSGYHFLTANTSNKYCFTVGGGTYSNAACPAITSGTHHLAGTWDGTNIHVYVDGSSVATYADTAITETNPVDVGTIAGSSQFWHGTIDEARISATDRSADWIATEYNNQSSPGTFYALGSETYIGAAAVKHRIMQ